MSKKQFLEKRKGSKVQIIRSIGDFGEVKNEKCTAKYTVAQVDTLAENDQGKSNVRLQFQFWLFYKFFSAGICLNEVVFGKEFVERKAELNESDQRKCLNKNKKVRNYTYD